MRKRILVISMVLLMSTLAFRIVDNRFEVSKNLEIFAAVYKQLDISYVEETKPGELMRTGIDAMLKSLDPYTVYYSEAQAEDALTMRTGEYGGLGINVTKIEEYLVVTDVFEGYSAQKAGMRIGDKLIVVNGKNVKGKSNTDLSPLMRGAKGTFVDIELERAGVGRKTLKVERVEVKLKNVPYYSKIGNDIAYIHLANFMQGAANEVKEALIKLKKEGCKSVLLDLRGNPGGLLWESVDIVNIFAPRNQLVVFTKGRNDADYKEYKTRNSPVDLTIPVVVMVNERSASASEIVSGTLQDLDRAVVVGVNSFGKGLVQTTRGLPYRTQMKLTTAKYYTPSGRCIQSLNYGKKDAFGKPIKTADSLRQEFKTKNGRKVLDGGGILPDVLVNFDGNKQIIKQLEDKHLIFDFAVDYLSQKTSEVKVDFNITDKEFSDFMIFLEGEKTRLKSPTDVTIDLLEKNSKEENLAMGSQTFTELRSKAWSFKKKQILANKELLKNLLSLEIIRLKGLKNLHYQGKFKKDPTVLKSIELLRNSISYTNILK